MKTVATSTYNGKSHQDDFKHWSHSFIDYIYHPYLHYVSKNIFSSTNSSSKIRVFLKIFLP